MHFSTSWRTWLTSMEQMPIAQANPNGLEICPHEAQNWTAPPKCGKTF
jgi:hypothetical protein